jgi:hypothetical protein
MPSKQRNGRTGATRKHGSTTRADIIAVARRRDVELVNTQTKLDKWLSPCMTIATSGGIPTPSCILSTTGI